MSDVHRYSLEAITAYDETVSRIVVYGKGSLGRLPELCEQRGFRRAFLLTTRSLLGSEAVRSIEEHLGERLVGVACGARQHVPADSLDTLIASVAEARPDLLVTLGGGSVIDSGKAVAAALATGCRTGQELLAYRAVFRYPDEVSQRPYPTTFLPHLAVPTTLSAAEYDGIFGYTAEGVKHLSIAPGLAPQVVILDPTVTLLTPQELWTSTGVRAVDHCVEAYLSRSPTPVTDAAALHGLEMLFEFLPRCADDPGDLEARLQCQLAGWLSMLGVSNVVLGLSHGIGHQLGGRCDVPHGVTSCVMLPPVIDLIARRLPAARPRLARLAAAMGKLADGDAAAGVRRLVARLGLPSQLSALGVRRDQFPAIAEAAMADLVVAFAPVRVDHGQVMELLEAAY
ncbi:MAG TPA: iron-containing alcohol dehydrogenase [Candidatus Dormibacteraeota bacterium]|nr:iron-containing alcohol dehydrogenase [Candidatus Dormibacteraeota bacterium]